MHTPVPLLTNERLMHTPVPLLTKERLGEVLAIAPNARSQPSPLILSPAMPRGGGE